jgi:RNA-binding protein YlmH
MLSFPDRIKHIIEEEKSVSLRFLTLYEQSFLTNQANILLDGGYQEAEKKRAYCFMDIVDNIACYQIKHHSAHLVLTHQNILGTLLSLGITVDSIGDILPKQGVFFITTEIEQVVLNQFSSIQHVPITITPYPKELVVSETRFERLRTTVDSLRLDLIVSKMIKTNRDNAKQMINNELIKVNHHITTKHTYQIKEKDIISIRKHGRFIINDASSYSKKGKIILHYTKYV